MSKKVSLVDATKRREEFVRGMDHEAVDTVVRLDVKTARQEAGPKKKATFNMDAELHHRLKVAAAVHRREMVEMVEEALGAYLERVNKRKG